MDAANAERGTYHDRLQKWKDALAAIDEEKMAAPTEPRKRRRTTFGDEHIDGVDDDDDLLDSDGDGDGGGGGGSIVSGRRSGSSGISEGPRGSHYCRPCRQHFQSSHDMRQHQASRKHQLMTSSTPIEAATRKAFQTPIFTAAFTDHFQSQEKEMRDLRRGNEAFLQQSSVLTDQINKLAVTAEKLAAEKARLDTDAAAIEAETAKLKAQTLAALKGFALPYNDKVGVGMTAEADPDRYLEALATVMTDASTPDAFKASVQDALKVLDQK